MKTPEQRCADEIYALKVALLQWENDYPLASRDEYLGKVKEFYSDAMDCIARTFCLEFAVKPAIEMLRDSVEFRPGEWKA